MSRLLVHSHQSVAGFLLSFLVRKYMFKGTVPVERGKSRRLNLGFERRYHAFPALSSLDDGVANF